MDSDEEFRNSGTSPVCLQSSQLFPRKFDCASVAFPAANRSWRGSQKMNRRSSELLQIRIFAVG
jgi:hypothetical protein